MNCWSTWSTPRPNQRPREPPTWCKNKVGQKYILCNLIDWFPFNLLFDWRSRSKVETYICQKVEDSWIYNLGGGHLWVLVKQIQDSCQVVTRKSYEFVSFYLNILVEGKRKTNEILTIFWSCQSSLCRKDFTGEWTFRFVYTIVKVFQHSHWNKMIQFSVLSNCIF